MAVYEVEAYALAIGVVVTFLVQAENVIPGLLYVEAQPIIGDDQVGPIKGWLIITILHTFR
jgi:hypothetical protein